MKRYNTPHRHRVIKTRLTEEEYTEFSERVTLCGQGRIARLKPDPSGSQPDRERQNFLHFFYVFISPEQIQEGQSRLWLYVFP